MASIGRKVQENGQGQLTITIPKQLAIIHDIEKGTMLYFDTVVSEEINLDDIVFIVRKGKK